MDKFEDFINCDQIIKYKKKIRNFDEMFSIDELQIIFNAMDKTDYSQMGRNRWLDLESLLNLILKTKNVHNLAILTKLTLSGARETFPPQNIYNFDYNFSEE